ncbi:hypothetical protein NDN08_003973 [Rhodosorus marinus]|uniref:Uncharacterized protein n=1 Tax=Rhodosorus marinus TaxID=101924 RepID=A0AAV8UKH7_9RHOD|nr:hypothetical protein NDN08_003973 [Rhodosorus marinus]
MGENEDRFDKFDGKPTSDFNGWLRSLEMRLEREGLWDVVSDYFQSEGGNKRSSGSHAVMSETRMESFKDPAVVMKEGKASALIIEALEERPLAIVNGFLRDPVEMLNRLREQYSIADTLVQLAVQDELFALEYCGGDILEYIEEFDGCVSRLLIAEPDFPQELILKQFFESLRSLYDTPRLHLLRRQHLTDLHWDKVSRILVAEANIIANRRRNRKSTRSVAKTGPSISKVITGPDASDAVAVGVLAKKKSPDPSHETSENNVNEQNVHERVPVSATNLQLVEKSKMVAADAGLSQNALPGRENVSVDERKSLEVPTPKAPIAAEERTSDQQPLPAMQVAERTMTAAQSSHTEQEPIEALESSKQGTAGEPVASLRLSPKLRALQSSKPRETGKPAGAERSSSKSVGDQAGHRQVARDTQSTDKNMESDTENKSRVDSRDVKRERNIVEREVQKQPVQKPKLPQSTTATCGEQRVEPEQGAEADSDSTETDTSTERNLVAEVERLSGGDNQHSSPAKSPRAGGSTSQGATSVGGNVDASTKRVLRSSIRASVTAQRKMTANVSKPGSSEKREAPAVQKGAQGYAQSDIGRTRVQSDPLPHNEIRMAPKLPKKMPIEPLVRRNRQSNSSRNDPGSDEQFARGARDVRRRGVRSNGVEAPDNSVVKADIVKSPDGPSAAALPSSPIDQVTAKRREPFHAPVHGESSADDRESLGKEKGTGRQGPDPAAGRLKTPEERFSVLPKLMNRQTPDSGRLRLITESPPTSRVLSQPGMNPRAVGSSTTGHTSERRIGDATVLRASQEMQRGKDWSGSAAEKTNNSVDKRGAGETPLRVSPVSDEYQMAIERQRAEQKRRDSQASAHIERKTSVSAQRTPEMRSLRDPRTAGTPNVTYRGADPRLRRNYNDGEDAVQGVERTTPSQESALPKNSGAGTSGTEALLVQTEEEAGRSADGLRDGSRANLGKENSASTSLPPGTDSNVRVQEEAKASLPSEAAQRSLTKPSDRVAPDVEKSAKTSPDRDTNEAQALDLARSSKQLELGTADPQSPRGSRIRDNQELASAKPSEECVAGGSRSNHARTASARREASGAVHTDMGISIVVREAERKVKDEPGLHSEQRAAPEGEPSPSYANALDAHYTGQQANKPTGVARPKLTMVKDEPVLRRDQYPDAGTQVRTASDNEELLHDSQSVGPTGRQGSAFPRASITPFRIKISGKLVGDSDPFSKWSGAVDTAKEVPKDTTPDVGVGSSPIAEAKIGLTAEPAASGAEPQSTVNGAESPKETVGRNLFGVEADSMAIVGEAEEVITSEKKADLLNGDQVTSSDAPGSGGGKKVVWAKELTREYALTEVLPSADIEANVMDDQHSKEVGAVSMQTPEDCKAPPEESNEDYDYEDYEYPLEETRMRNKHARKKKRDLDRRDQVDVGLCPTCKRFHPGTCRYNPSLNSKRRKRMEKKSKFLEKINQRFHAEEITKANSGSSQP